MKKIQSTFIALILSILLIPSIPAHANDNVLNEIKYYVENYYYGEVPKNLENLQTIDAVINQLDEHSTYLTKGEYNLFLRMIGESPTKLQEVAATQTSQTTITSHLLHEDTGTIIIPKFSEDLGKIVAQHWQTLKNQGAKRLIIDLRNNGGGYVESAEELLAFFESINNAYYQVTRAGEKLIRTTTVTNPFPKETYLLINRQSASASEIVAVSTKDHNVAILVGEKTYGKGTMQSIFKLSDGGALKLTTGQYKGPKNTIVNQKGITPHIEAAPNTELAAAHRTIIEKSLTKQFIRQSNPTQLINTHGPIRINFNQKTNFKGTNTSNRIELIELGGNAIPVTITQAADGLSINIQPTQQLKPNTDYIVVIKPEMKRLNGKLVKMGMYTNVSMSTGKN